jgi:hypothetical protein
MKYYLAIYVLLLSVSGFASQAQHGAMVDLTPSQIEADAQAQEIKPDNQRSAWIDLGVSSWVPGSFVLPSTFSSTAMYQGNGLPAFYANYLMQFTHGSDFSLKAGVNWLSLTRSGLVATGATSSLSDESVQLLSLRVGAEYAPSSLSSRYFTPFVGAALLPSVAIEPSSTFDSSGNTYFGIPVEFTVGSRFSLDTLNKALQGVELDLAAIGTTGTIDHSSVGGIGINGGVRLAL